LSHLYSGHWEGELVALPAAAVELFEDGELRRCFDAFGRYTEFERISHCNDCGDERSVVRVGCEPVDECLVDIYDPHTRTRPSNLISVTLAGRNLSIVDAYATAAFAMGDHAADWIESLPDCRALVIYRDGARWS
jgi:hypothetical protein